MLTRWAEEHQRPPKPHKGHAWGTWPPTTVTYHSSGVAARAGSVHLEARLDQDTPKSIPFLRLPILNDNLTHHRKLTGSPQTNTTQPRQHQNAHDDVFNPPHSNTMTQLTFCVEVVQQHDLTSTLLSSRPRLGWGVLTSVVLWANHRFRMPRPKLWTLKWHIHKPNFYVPRL